MVCEILCGYLGLDALGLHGIQIKKETCIGVGKEPLDTQFFLVNVSMKLTMSYQNKHQNTKPHFYVKWFLYSMIKQIKQLFTSCDSYVFCKSFSLRQILPSADVYPKLELIPLLSVIFICHVTNYKRQSNPFGPIPLVIIL